MNRLRVYNSTSGDEGKDGRETAVVIIEIETSSILRVCANRGEPEAKLDPGFARLESTTHDSSTKNSCCRHCRRLITNKRVFLYIKLLQAHPLYIAAFYSSSKLIKLL